MNGTASYQLTSATGHDGLGAAQFLAAAAAAPADGTIHMQLPPQLAMVDATAEGQRHATTDEQHSPAVDMQQVSSTGMQQYPATDVPKVAAISLQQYAAVDVQQGAATDSQQGPTSDIQQECTSDNAQNRAAGNTVAVPWPMSLAGGPSGDVNTWLPNASKPSDKQTVPLHAEDSSGSSMLADSTVENASSILWPPWMDSSSGSSVQGRTTDISGGMVTAATATDTWLARVMHPTVSHDLSAQYGRNDTQGLMHPRLQPLASSGVVTKAHTSCGDRHGVQGTAQVCNTSHISVADLVQGTDFAARGYGPCITDAGRTGAGNNTTELHQPDGRHAAGASLAGVPGMAAQCRQLSSSGSPHLLSPASSTRSSLDGCLESSLSMSHRPCSEACGCESEPHECINSDSRLPDRAYSSAASSVAHGTAAAHASTASSSGHVSAAGAGEMTHRTPSKSLMMRGCLLHAPPSPMELLQAELMDGSPDTASRMVQVEVLGSRLNAASEMVQAELVDVSPDAVSKAAQVEVLEGSLGTAMVACYNGLPTTAPYQQQQHEDTCKMVEGDAGTANNLAAGSLGTDSQLMQDVSPTTTQFIEVVPETARHMPAAFTTIQVPAASHELVLSASNANMPSDAHQMVSADAAEHELLSQMRSAATAAAAVLGSCSPQGHSMQSNRDEGPVSAAASISDSAFTDSALKVGCVYSSGGISTAGISNGSGSSNRRHSTTSDTADIVSSTSTGDRAQKATMCSSSSSSSRCSHSSSGSQTSSCDHSSHKSTDCSAVAAAAAAAAAVFVEAGRSSSHPMRHSATNASTGLSAAGHSMDHSNAGHCEGSSSEHTSPDAASMADQVVGQQVWSVDGNSMLNWQDKPDSERWGSGSQDGSGHKSRHSSEREVQYNSHHSSQREVQYNSQQGSQRHSMGAACDQQQSIVYQVRQNKADIGLACSLHDGSSSHNCHNCHNCQARQNKADLDSAYGLLQGLMQPPQQQLLVRMQLQEQAVEVCGLERQLQRLLSPGCVQRVGLSSVSSSCRTEQGGSVQGGSIPLPTLGVPAGNCALKPVQTGNSAAGPSQPAVHQALNTAGSYSGQANSVQTGNSTQQPAVHKALNGHSGSLCTEDMAGAVSHLLYEDTEDAVHGVMYEGTAGAVPGVMCEGSTAGAVRGLVLGSSAVMTQCHYDHASGQLTSRAHVSLLSLNLNSPASTVQHGSSILQPAGVTRQQAQLTAGVTQQQDQLTGHQAQLTRSGSSASRLQPARQALAGLLHGLAGKPAPTAGLLHDLPDSSAPRPDATSVQQLQLQQQQQEQLLASSGDCAKSQQFVCSSCRSPISRQSSDRQHMFAISPHGRGTAGQRMEMLATPTRSGRAPSYGPSSAWQPSQDIASQGIASCIASCALRADEASLDTPAVSVTMTPSLASVTVLRHSSRQCQRLAVGALNIQPPSIRRPSIHPTVAIRQGFSLPAQQQQSQLQACSSSTCQTQPGCPHAGAGLSSRCVAAHDKLPNHNCQYPGQQTHSSTLAACHSVQSEGGLAALQLPATQLNITPAKTNISLCTETATPSTNNVTPGRNHGTLERNSITLSTDTITSSKSIIIHPAKSLADPGNIVVHKMAGQKVSAVQLHTERVNIAHSKGQAVAAEEGAGLQQLGTQLPNVGSLDSHAAGVTSSLSPDTIQAAHEASNISPGDSQTVGKSSNISPGKSQTSDMPHESRLQEHIQQLDISSCNTSDMSEESRLQEHIQQGKEAALVCALLMQPGSGLQAVLQGPVTPQEQQQLHSLKRIVNTKQVLSPVERMQLWGTVEQVLATRLQSPQQSSQAGAALQERSARQAETAQQRGRAGAANTAGCIQQGGIALQEPGAQQEWAAQQGGAAQLDCSAQQTEQWSSPASSTSTPIACMTDTQQLSEGIIERLPMTSNTGLQGQLVDETVCQVHRVVAPNATLAWAMDRNWAQLRTSPRAVCSAHT